MRKLTLFFLCFFFLKGFDCIPVICVDSPLGLAVSADNCEEMQIYKLKDNLCSSDFQRIEIDPQIHVFNPYFLPHGYTSIPVDFLSERHLKMLPKVRNAMLEICPERQRGFLKLGADLSHLNEVRMVLFNASGRQGNQGPYKNYYQDAPIVGQFSFESEPNLNLKELNKYFQVFNDNATYIVESAKIYSQYCGELPSSFVPIESTLSLENPYKHIFDIITFVEFAFMNTSALPNQKNFIEFHEVLEFCLKSDADNETQQVIMDRVVIRTEKLKIFNSQINVYYNGLGDGCSVNSTKWADYKSGICYEDIPCLAPRNALQNLNYPMDNVIKIATDFLLNFRIFNWGVFNCQHFATNTWNLITNDTLDFENAKEMTVHAKRSGLQPAAPYL